MSRKHYGTSTTVSSTAAGGSTSILTILQVIFIVLKLTGVGSIASWSWTKVLIPTWISLGIFAVVFIVFLIIVIIEAIKNRR